jgi:hypothetical protein
MKLRTYMEANSLDDDAMARLVGDCTHHAVKKWKYGERFPRPEQLKRLSEVTSGQVTANDFVSGSGGQKGVLT